MTRPTIEVRGIGFPNKGAELMLDACVEFIQSCLPGARVTVVPIGPRHYALEQLRQRGIVPRVHMRRFGLGLQRVLSLVPTALRNSANWTIAGDEDVVLDASGFAYGDVWGPRKVAQRAATQSLALRRNPRLKVIFLPQAFGPFADPDVASQTKKILEPAKLIYPRDEESLAHLASIGISGDRVRIAPDFTNLVSPGGCDESVPSTTVGLIPNEKMRGQSGYIQLFADVADALRRDGRQVAFLLHEGDRDQAVIDEIVKLMKTGAPTILKPADARAVKACIGACTVVVGSRFHGLVSALNQGVPAVAIGWSHKYRTLFAQYGLEHFASDFPTSAEWVHACVDTLLSPELPEVLRQLEAANVAQERAVMQMWNEVEHCLLAGDAA